MLSSCIGSFNTLRKSLPSLSASPVSLHEGSREGLPHPVGILILLPLVLQVALEERFIEGEVAAEVMMAQHLSVQAVRKDLVVTLAPVFRMTAEELLCLIPQPLRVDNG
jgi:hypothetical protein